MLYRDDVIADRRIREQHRQVAARTVRVRVVLRDDHAGRGGDHHHLLGVHLVERALADADIGAPVPAVHRGRVVRARAAVEVAQRSRVGVVVDVVADRVVQEFGPPSANRVGHEKRTCTSTLSAGRRRSAADGPADVGLDGVPESALPGLRDVLARRIDRAPAAVGVAILALVLRGCVAGKADTGQDRENGQCTHVEVREGLEPLAHP